MEPSIDELSGQCFGCGPQNPEGLHLRFAVDRESHSAEAAVELDERYQGAPGYVHGGIIATLLDEAMSKLNRPMGLLAMTRHMAVNYLRPVPIHAKLTVRGRHQRREGRKLFHEAELLDESGTVLARCEGLWIVVNPEVIQQRAGVDVEPA